METGKIKPGFYRVDINLLKAVWIIPEKYTKLEPIGGGAFGQVCSAVDKETEEKVAIKKLTRPFQTDIHAQRCYREIRVLKTIQHENLIEYYDSFTPDSSLEDFQQVYIVTKLMACDLNRIIKSQKLTDQHIQFFVYQILRGLKYLHSAQLVHRDLKPSNLAVNDTCELRILDFGLIRKSDFSNNKNTAYVQTRWYRAPEIMLNWMDYNQKVDIWSVGCIMAELFIGKPLLQGDDYIKQLMKTMEIRGTPSPELLARMSCKEAVKFVQSLPNMPKKDLQQIIPEASSLAIDLLEKMLDLDPESRITVDEAIQHPFLETYHDSSDEPTTVPYVVDHDDEKLSIQDWKKILWEILLETNESMDTS